MKYIGRTTLVLFTLTVSIIESYYDGVIWISLIEAVLFAALAFFIGQFYDHASYYRRKSQKSEEQYRHLIEFSPDPIIVYQGQEIVYVNSKVEQLVQEKANNIIGRSIFDYILPPFHEKIKERILKAELGDKEVTQMAIKVQVSENRFLDIEATSVSIMYNNKPSVEVFLRDVTARNKLEERSRKNEDLYKFITENSTDIISYIKPNGDYDYMSPSCLEILGYHQDEVNHKNLFQFIHPDEAQQIYELFTEARSYMDFASFPHRYKKKDGSFIWLETNARTIRNNKKELEGIVTVSRDISGRIEKEKDLLETNEMLRYLSNFDGLTDIPNRRYFEETLKKEWKENLRHSKPLSLLMVDIDNFKKYNDYYGHQSGDGCIQQIAKAFKETLKRKGDFVARYGGEEFIVLLPETDSKGAGLISESLLTNVRDLIIPTKVSDVSDYVTISIGCATVVPTDQMKPEELIKLADKELYAAKALGKDQVRLNDLCKTLG